MDIRTLRNKKSKSRNARPYDRQNQSLLGKVASKVKGILYPSWLSTWMSSGEEPGYQNDPSDEESADEEDVPQISARGSKRPRLRLHEHSPPILSEGTQTWLDAPSTSTIFNQEPGMPSAVTQSTLMQSKESAVIMNGDDHSENSEESASTSGCSSLVSHKDRSNCIVGSNLMLREREMEKARRDLKDFIALTSRQSVTSQNESLSVNVGSSRMSLWSGSGNCSPATNLLSRSATVVQRSQPGFNVSAFIGTPKLNQSTDSKISSPFYQGRTTFGGASSIRRMPVSVAPYQVDKPLRDQIKVRPNQFSDSLEGMSSAAKRILMTLEKMSSPVTDAKKIPNTNKSPVDLSLYLMPPKHGSNVVSSPVAATKGPPIANISTISKLTTLKSCSLRRFHNSTMESLPIPNQVEDRDIVNDSVQQDISPFASKGGGGKMRNKLTQQHQSSARQRESELLESTPLPNIPLPISTLPTIDFGSNFTQNTNKGKISETDFTFSNPIVLPKPSTALKSTEATDSPQMFVPVARTDKSNDDNQAFTFSRPIELDFSFASPSVTNFSNSTTMWECSSCWVRNASEAKKCLACEAPKNSQDSATTLPSTAAAPIISNSNSTWECSSCWIRNPVKEAKCMACEEPKPVASSTSSTETTFKSTSGFGSAFSAPATWECNACWIRNPVDQIKCLACETPKMSEPSTALPSSSMKSGSANSLSTWKCSGCWVQNPMKEAKCLACEAPNPSHKGSSGESTKDAAKSATSNSGSFFGATSSTSGSFFSLSNTTTTTSGFKMPSSLNGPQTVSFGGFKIPVSKPSDSDTEDKMSGDKEQQVDSVTKTAPSKSNSISLATLAKSSSSLKRKQEAESSSNINGPNSVSTSLSQKSSNVSEKEKANNNFSLKPNATTSVSSLLSAFSTKPNSRFAASGDWECDICLVRNSADMRTCPACESSRLVNQNASGLKDPDIFKFSSPLQGSPITFKFSAPADASVTDTSTTTSSNAGFTFSTPSSTTANSLFASALSSSSIQKSLAESKSLLANEATKLPVPEFKFDAPKLPSADAVKPSIPIINLAGKTESSEEAKQLPDLNPASKNTATSSVSFAFNSSKSSNTNSTTNSVTFSTPDSTDSSKAFLSSQPEASSVNVQDSKKLGENATSGQSSLPTGGFNFKIPSSTPMGGLFSHNKNFGAKTADAPSPKTVAPKQPLSKVSEAGDEKKTTSPFLLSSSTPSLVSSPFGQSSPASSVFSVGDNATQKSSTEPLSAGKNCFAVSTTSSSPATSSFNFSNNSTGAFSLVPSSGAQPSMPTASSLLQFQSGVNKSQDVKAVAPVSALSSTLTSSTFTFGDSAAAPTTTQPSVSTGFTFFSSTATTTATTSSGSGMFSFSSPQVSKPSGFTFKSSTEEKPNPVSSNSISFGVPTTTASSSSVFKFGATAPASTGGFVFGAVKAEPVTTASSGFSFGAGNIATTNPSTFSGFQPAQPAATAPAPVFQFGAQPFGGATPVSQCTAQSSAPDPQFGANSNFSFGTKSETTNPLTQPVPGAVAPSSGFGGATTQPMFGNTPALAFGKTDVYGFKSDMSGFKTDKAGFNFGAAATGAAPVFQFGNMEKKPAPPQFSFGVPSQEAATANSFVPTFNMNTPPSFNFGAASSPVQPFQFAASTDSSLNSSSGHRKIRKAVRRVQNKH